MSQINIGNIDNLKFALGDVEDIQLYLGEIKLYPLNNYKYDASGNLTLTAGPQIEN